MIKRRYILTGISLLALLFGACKSTQTSVAQNEANSDYLFKGEFKTIKKDRLGFIYLVNGNDEVLKYSPDFKLKYTFSTRRLGGLAYLDVTNPQKILLYYNDFQHIIFLDNTLSEIKRLNLENFGFWNIQSVAMAGDNHIWIYDPDAFQLKKISDSGLEILASNELHDEYLGRKPIIEILERHNEVFLNTGQGIMVLNNLGQFLRHYPNLQTQKFKVLNEDLAYISSSGIVFRSLKPSVLNHEIQVNLETKAKDFIISESGFLILEEGGVRFKEI